MGGFTAVYDKMQPNKDGSQNKIGELKLERPMEVLFEGADEDIYKPLTKDEISTEFLDWLNDEVPERYLSVRMRVCVEVCTIVRTIPAY